MCQSRFTTRKRSLTETSLVEEDAGSDGRETSLPRFTGSLPDDGNRPSADEAEEGFRERGGEAQPGRGEATKRRRRSRWDSNDCFNLAVPMSRTTADGDAAAAVAAAAGVGSKYPGSAATLPTNNGFFGKNNDEFFAKNNDGFCTPLPAATTAAGDSEGNDAAAVKLKSAATWVTVAGVASVQVPLPTTPPMSGAPSLRRVYAGNLAYGLTKLDVCSLFTLFGAISQVSMPLDTSMSRHRGFAFIDFVDAAAAEAALRMEGLLVADR